MDGGDLGVKCAGTGSGYGRAAIVAGGVRIRFFYTSFPRMWESSAFSVFLDPRLRGDDGINME